MQLYANITQNPKQANIHEYNDMKTYKETMIILESSLEGC